jgi:hypothetical protein
MTSRWFDFGGDTIIRTDSYVSPWNGKGIVGAGGTHADCGTDTFV